MARDEGTTGRKRRGPRFKDLSKATQQQRITRAEEAGRLSAEKAEAARRHWGLAPGAEEGMARSWAARNAAFAPGELRKPKRVPSAREQEIAEHVSLVQRGRGVTKPRFIAPPPPKTPRDARVRAAAQANWALRAPVDLPGRGARRQLARTATEQETRDIYEGRKPPRLTAEEQRAWNAVQKFSKPGLMDRLPGAVADFFLSPEDQATALETLAASGQTATALGRPIGSALGTAAGFGAEQLVRRTPAGALGLKGLQAAGVDRNVAEDIGEIVHNFVQQVSEGAVGIGPGAAEFALHPGEMTKAIVDFYAQNFADPARKGDWGEFAANLKKNPDVVLDLLGFSGAAIGAGSRIRVATRAARAADMVDMSPTRAAARALRTGKEPVRLYAPGGEGRVTWGKATPTRFHQQRVAEVEGPTGKVAYKTKQTPVQRYVSENTQGRLLGDLWDKWTTHDPTVRWIGRRRERKHIRETAEMDRDRLFGPIERFQAMGRRIQDDPDPGKSMAFDRMLWRGGTPEEVRADIDREIQTRVAAGWDETEMQREELRVLQNARAYLADEKAMGRDNFLDVVAQGRVLSNRTQNLLVEARLLKPETAERMLNQPVQFLEGAAPPVEGPMRDMFEATLKETWGEDNPAIDAALKYLDVQAHSFARRNGVEPEAFYREMYHSAASVDAEDFMSALNDANDEVWLTQQRGPEFEITEERAGQHLKAHRDLIGENGEEARLAAEARAMPKQGAVAMEVRFQRILDQIGEPSERAYFARWYKDIPAEFERYFGADAEAAMRSWLASQVATSPAGGMLGLLKAMEYRYLNGRWPEKGFNVNIAAMGKAWDDVLGTDPAGVAAKISDFFNSAYGLGTRTWLQHAPGYGPGVVDRWTLRSDGFHDHQAYSSLTGRGVEGVPDPKTDPSFYDMTAGPDAYQYEWSSIRLNQLKDMFNEAAVDGRNDWAVEEIQALDWFATRREWGEPGGGWDDTWGRNTREVIGEVVGEQVRDWLREGERGAIVTDVSHNGAHGRVEILGTVTQAHALARKLANESGRKAYDFFIAGKETSAPAGKPRRLGLDVLPSEGADASYIFDSLRLKVGALEEKGLLVLPYGNGGVRIMFTDDRGRLIKGVNARKERDQLARELQDLGIEVRPIAAQMGVHNASRPQRGLYRGVDPRGVFARGAAARRRGTDFRVAEVVGRDGADRFIAGLQRNTRAFSLSPRVVEDFTERGYRAFLSDDGLAGAALSPDGEIVSVFNSGGDKGLAAQAIIEAIANGGTWLNCYDGFLNPMYANVGFRESARLRFDDAMAPSDWTYEHGRPDIVFMHFAPDQPITRGRRVDTYPDPWAAGASRARRAGERGHNQRSVESMLAELADRGENMPTDVPGVGVLAQWKRKVKVTEGDPVVQGAVRVRPEGGVDLRVTNASNFSTLIHENAHATLRASLEWLADSDDPRLPEVLDALGLDAIEDLLDVDTTRRTQELWARTVETALYLNDHNGLISSPHLRQLIGGADSEMKRNYRRGIDQIAGEEFSGGEITKMLANDAVMSLLRDLHDVTYGSERRPDAVFLPRFPPTAVSKVSRAVQRASTNQNLSVLTPPKGKGPVAPGRNLGIRMIEGNYHYGPDVIARYATSAFRRSMREDLAHDIYTSPYVKPIQRDNKGNVIVEPGHLLFDYSKLPGVSRQLDERLGFQERAAAREREGDIDALNDDGPLDPEMMPQEVAEATRRATEEVFNEEMFLNPQTQIGENLAKALESETAVWVPERIYYDYLDAVTGSTALSWVSKWFGRDWGPVGSALSFATDLANAAQRWAMVLKPSYATANTLGAGVTATIHNPFWVGEIRKSADFLSDWPSEELRALDDFSGSGSYTATQIAIEDDVRKLNRFSKRERAAQRKIAEVMTTPERRIRRMVSAKTLRDAGYTTWEDFANLRKAAETDPAARATYNQLSRWSEDVAVRFRGMNQFEQAIVRRGIFVYAWIRAALRYTARFPINQPVLAAAMNRIGNQGWEDIQDALGKSIGFRGGLVRGVKETPSGRMVKMMDLSSLFPFGSGAEPIRILTGSAAGLAGQEWGYENFSDLLSAGPDLALTTIMGESTFGQSPIDVLKRGYWTDGGFAALPAVPWIYKFINPDITETKTYGPQSRKDILAHLALGQLWERWTKVDGAHAVWLRKQPRGVRAPAAAQDKQDKLLMRYEGAIATGGDGPIQEYTHAVQARSMYDTLYGNAGRLSGTDLENKKQRARWKREVLKTFYPSVYEDMVVDMNGMSAEEAIARVDGEYQTFVSDNISDMKTYIRKTLGEQALEGVE